MSNSKLDDFLDVPFGSSAETVKQRISLRYDSIFDEANSNADTLFFNGISFGGRPTRFILLLFHENKFCKACVYFKSENESLVIPTYQAIKEEINKKYFKTKQDYENFKSPYEKEDGFTITAIAKDKADFSCYWNFLSDGIEEDYISLKINDDLDIVLAYENGDLMDQLINKNKQDSSADF
jgi:hypothetical protein